MGSSMSLGTYYWKIAFMRAFEVSEGDGYKRSKLAPASLALTHIFTIVLYTVEPVQSPF